MKFNFWKKDKKANENQEINNKTMDKSDVSSFYDYDKVSHNQFLTGDEIKGKYFEQNSNQNQSQSAYSKKYNNAKTQNMVLDDLAFKRINDDINGNLNLNKSEFTILNNHANELNYANNKIPVKKKSFFSKKNNDYLVNEQIRDSSNNYNIVENNTNKFENSVDYYSLKKDQTKLLNLDEIISNTNTVADVGEKNIVENVESFKENKNTTLIDNNISNINLTNRLFSNDSNQQIDNSQTITESNTPIIPRKTIRLSFDTQNEYINLNEAKNNISNNMVSESNNSQNAFSTFNVQNKTNIINNQDQKRIPTTALRYLTPVEEEENFRIKKEERRFIKTRD